MCVSGDVKILCNDWPYGVDPAIKHLVVWTKFELPVSAEEARGDLGPDVRRRIDAFVEDKFRRVCGEERVVWFRNWSALKSVHAVEHFHVMLYDADPEFVRRITGGDVPLAEQVRRVE